MRILALASFAMAACAQPSQAAMVQQESSGAATHHHHVHSSALDTELQRQLDAVRERTAKYRNIQNAIDDGYVRFGWHEGPLMGEHWFRRDKVNRPLDLERPSTLQYATIGGERVLVGVAYGVYQRPEEQLPEGFAGHDDVWHVHDVEKLLDAVTDDRPILRRLAERRMRRTGAPPAKGRTHLVMLHAWVWLENPDGVFALQHRALPYLRAGLPAEWASYGDRDAAHGVALLSPNGCTTELRTTGALARFDRRQRAALGARCAQAAEDVRAAKSLGDARSLNDVAAREWRDYVALRDSLLDDRQKSWLASVIEHDEPRASHRRH